MHEEIWLEAARFALDAALLRRSSVALELASSGLLDPAGGPRTAAAFFVLSSSTRRCRAAELGR